MYVCVCARKTEANTETQRHRDSARQRVRHRGADARRDTARQEAEIVCDRHRGTHRNTARQRVRHRGTDAQRHRETRRLSVCV